MPADPYTTLGVSRNASADEVKKAYRKLAHQYHPDKKGGDEAKFKEVNEAYQVLSDPEKRARYDRFGSAEGPTGFGAGGFGGAGGFQDFDFGGMGGGFENIFDMFGGGMPGRRAKPEKGEDLQLRVTLHAKDFGKKKVYEFDAFVSCKTCSGSGAQGGKLKECGQCKGQGRVRQAVRTPFGTFAQVTVCPECGGDGQVPQHVCKECGGAGRVKGKRTLELHIPERIEDQYHIAFPKAGNAGQQGTPPGDLLITLQAK
ncbi:MAG: DnaJ domain-containing protein [Candidatus Yanofskybacteria bacterium]|nr:DnaJ domain-containing protein [Candidatus Yanofskybacteria bacterium]